MPHYSDYGGYSYSDEGELAENVDGENLGENIYLRENSIYTIVDGPLTWSEAEKQVLWLLNSYAISSRYLL